MLHVQKVIQTKFYSFREHWTLGIVLWGLVLTPSSKAAVEDHLTCSARHCVGGGGHDVPTPFDTSGNKFELADGEIYVLSGRVVSIPATGARSNKFVPYLSIDLSQYPWLANSKRAQAPLYPLEGNPLEWKEWVNFPIKIMCKAHGRIVTYHGKHEYVITLEPIAK